MAEQDNKKLATYKCKIEKIKSFLKSNSKNMGPSGKERKSKSNITDPQSAKMSTGHGVIQGYNGVAVVDEKHQIIVNAEAHGKGKRRICFSPCSRARAKGSRPQRSPPTCLSKQK